MRTWQAQLRAERIRGGAAQWTPPVGTMEWWYGDADIAGGQNWTGKLLGTEIAIPATLAVAVGAGVVWPLNVFTTWTTSYTPASPVRSVASWWRGNAAAFSGSNANGIGVRSSTASQCHNVYPTGHFVAVSGSALTALTPWTPGVWVHIAWTMTAIEDNTLNCQTYIDGVPFGSVANRVAPAPAMLEFNGNTRTDRRFSDASIDDVMVSALPWTAEQVADICSNSPGTHKP